MRRVSVHEYYGRIEKLYKECIRNAIRSVMEAAHGKESAFRAFTEIDRENTKYANNRFNGVTDKIDSFDGFDLQACSKVLRYGYDYKTQNPGFSEVHTLLKRQYGISDSDFSAAQTLYAQNLINLRNEYLGHDVDSIPSEKLVEMAASECNLITRLFPYVICEGDPEQRTYKELMNMLNEKLLTEHNKQSYYLYEILDPDKFDLADARLFEVLTRQSVDCDVDENGEIIIWTSNRDEVKKRLSNVLLMDRSRPQQTSAQSAAAEPKPQSAPKTDLKKKVLLGIVAALLVVAVFIAGIAIASGNRRADDAASAYVEATAQVQNPTASAEQPGDAQLPTAAPTEVPTAEPTAEPTEVPTPEPTEAPTPTVDPKKLGKGSTTFKKMKVSYQQTGEGEIELHFDNEGPYNISLWFTNLTDPGFTVVAENASGKRQSVTTDSGMGSYMIGAYSGAHDFTVEFPSLTGKIVSIRIMNVNYQNSENAYDLSNQQTITVKGK